MPLRGSARAEHPLELQAGDDIPEFFVTVLPESLRIDRFEPWGEDQSSHFDFLALCLLREIDRVCRADFFAGQTLSFFKIEAMLRINGILQGNSLGVSHIGCLAPAQTLVKFILHLTRAF